MDKNTLKKIMLENQEEVVRYSVIKREIDWEENANYVFVGIRRAGKSFLIYQRIQQLLSNGLDWSDMLYINFEDERLSDFGTEDFNLLLECHLEMYGKKPILFLDEIQNIPFWYKFARRMADQKYRVCITGSNAHMLSGEVHTTLGGRYLVKEVYPYDFLEYANAHDIDYSEHTMLTTTGRAAVLKCFNEYFHEGGFPEAALYTSKKNYLNSVYQKIYLGDVAARNGISNTIGLRVMLKKMAESVKQPLSYNRIASVVSSSGSKISVTSISKYVDHVCDAWLTLRVTNIAAKLADKESNAKYYFIDNGLLNLLLLDSETTLLENLAALTLLRRYGKDDAVFFYNKDIEVDFYVPDQEIAIQVSYSINSDETLQREVRALEALAKVLPVRKAFILTRDEEQEIETSGLRISVIPIWKFIIFNQVNNSDLTQNASY